MPMKNPPHPGDFIRTELIKPAGLSVSRLFSEGALQRQFPELDHYRFGLPQSDRETGWGEGFSMIEGSEQTSSAVVAALSGGFDRAPQRDRCLTFVAGSGGPLVQRPKESDASVFLERRIRDSA